MSAFSSFVLGVLAGIGGLWFFMNLDLFQQFLANLGGPHDDSTAPPFLDGELHGNLSDGHSRGTTVLPKVLLISFDGFRWDYIHMTDTPNIDWMIQRGTHAPRGIKNTFITVTAPNHYAMITGLYEESSGIVSNEYLDVGLNETFDYWHTLGATDPRLFAHGVPIWSLNDALTPPESSRDVDDGTKRHLQPNDVRRTGCSQWIGCDVKIGGFPLPYFHESWNESQKFDDFFGRVDKMMQLFLDEENPINLGVLYFPQPDEAGHQWGPDGYQTWEVVRQMDELMGYILWALERSGLLNSTNVILTADHGMASVPVANNVYLEDYIQRDWFDSYGSGTTWNMQPKMGFEDIIIENLSGVKGLSVYKKADMPPEYHYRFSENILDLQILADLHYNIQLNRSESGGPMKVRSKLIALDDGVYGVHGYNNSLPEMHPIFVAMGPAFKVGYQSAQFENVDIYPLMAHILEIPLAKLPPNNGSFARVKSLLNQEFLDDYEEEISAQFAKDRSSISNLISGFMKDADQDSDLVSDPDNLDENNADETGAYEETATSFHGKFSTYSQKNLPLTLFAIMFMIVILVSLILWARRAARIGGGVNTGSFQGRPPIRRSFDKRIRKEDICLIQPESLHLRRDDESMIVQLAGGIDSLDLGMRRDGLFYEGNGGISRNLAQMHSPIGSPPPYYSHEVVPTANPRRSGRRPL